MGCSSSKPCSEAPAAVNESPNDLGVVSENTRRRFSVNVSVKGAAQQSSQPEKEVPRGKLIELESMSELLKQAQKAGGKRKRGSVCIGSATDAQIVEGFSNKRLVKEGDGEASSGHLGFVCKKGLKPDSLNQDSWAVLQVAENFSFYGVFDGHGPQGHHVSNFVKEQLPRMIMQDTRFQSWMKAETDSPERQLKDLESVAKEAFIKMQSQVAAADGSQFNASLSGSTGTICIFDHKANKYLVAHVADSTCVRGNLAQHGEALTRDHKPELEGEKERIEKAGGKVVYDGYANHRVYDESGITPGMNMSRCLGDLHAHRDCGIIAEPETRVVDVRPDDAVLLLCSDGVWEFMDPTAAVGTVMPFFEQNDAKGAAEKLAKEAWDRWIKEEEGEVVDDITVICVFLNKEAEASTGQDAEKEAEVEPASFCAAL